MWQQKWSLLTFSVTKKYGSGGGVGKQNTGGEKEQDNLDKNGRGEEDKEPKKDVAAIVLTKKRNKGAGKERG